MLIAVYYAIIYRFAPNSPAYDDVVILFRILDLKNEHTIKSFAQLLIAQHNEHRVGVLTLITFAYYGLVGKIHFAPLTLFGNLFFVGAFFAMIYGVVGNFRLVSRLSWVIAGLIFFQMRPWETQIWAMTSISGFPALFFSMLAIIMIGKPKPIFVLLAVLFSFLAAFSQANGLF